MADELPKDYSTVYGEDSVSRILKPNNPRPYPRQLISDGIRTHKKHSESTVDLLAVVAKLENLPQEENNAYAMNTLNQHYSAVFVNKRKTDSDHFKAYIQYFDEKDTYVVRVNSNTLKAVMDKLPKRGNYRYFFKQMDNTCEEVESPKSNVPYHEKDGSKQIYCQIFPS